MNEMKVNNEKTRVNSAVKVVSTLIIVVLLASPGFGQVTADFNHAFINGLECAESPIQFTNTSSTSSGSVELTTWDFGDGESSSVLSPTHTYSEAGTYTVTLTVQNTNGDFDSHQEVITVNPIPQVNFTIAGSTPDQCISTTQAFNNLSTVSPGTMTYVWDFDGLDTSTDEDPSFDFPGADTYDITLTATVIGTACNNNLTKPVTIHPEAVVDFSFSNECNGEPVSFTNHSEVSSGNMSYTWTFGDGNNSSQTNPVHNYSTAGDYTVRLTVTTQEGCETFLEQVVTVYDQPTAGFTFSNVCFGLPVNFVNTSLLADSYSWELGDGSTSSAMSPSHTYTAPGTYQVRLISSNAEGCSDEMTRFITVYPVPIANFEVTDVCLGSSAIFTNNSEISSGNLTYQWDFGDAGISTATNPAHTYTSTGIFTVNLTATSNFNCEDVEVKDVEVFDNTVAGTVNGGTTLCASNNSSNTLTLTGNTGNVVRWERSETGIDQWTTIENTSTTLDYSSLDKTTYFRSIVQNGVCSQQTTAMATVQIDPVSVGGTLAGSTSVCAGANSGSVTLSGQQGDVVQWLRSETSENGPWTPLANVSTTQNFLNLTQTTHYRAVVSSGVCENDTSEVATVTVFPTTTSGLLTGSATVCRGINSGALTLAGHTGAVVRWESSPTANGPWTSISNETSALSYSNLLATTYYRAVVKSGVCETLSSNVATITVDEATIAGVITGTNNVCEQVNSGTLNLTGFLGSVVRWQSSPDATTWQDIANTTATHTFANLDETIYYRSEVQNGVCSSAFTPTYEVTVHPLPEVSFSSISVCEGTATAFANASSISSGKIDEYFWDFSTGTASVHPNPVYTFPEAGDYQVKLKATSAAGCVDSATNQVRVHPNPVAGFSQENVCQSETMTFTDLSTVLTGAIDFYEWDFDDGNTSATPDPDHLFGASGSYTVSLSIRTDEGCTDEIRQEVHVDPRPVTAFNFENQCDGRPVGFQNNTSITSGNLVYTWNFGDGSSSNVFNPIHSYPGAGEYNARLTATSPHGCETSQTLTVTIYEQPVALFTAEDVCSDAEVVFENASAGANVSYTWDFGDDESSGDEDPIHRYGASGTYPVSLFVESDDGCTDTFTKQVKVHPLPTVSFVFQDACDTVAVPFSNLSSIPSGRVSYAWDFGDGSVSGETSPVHRYPGEGSYSVGLTGTSDFGCSEYLEKTLQIFPRPQAGFDVSAVCDGEISRFQNTSTLEAGTIRTFTWDFGDGTNSLVEHPAKQYLNEGTYEASLVVSSDHWCESRVSRTVVVHEYPIADFEVENVCTGFPVALINRSFIGAGNLTFSWQLGDGSASAQAGPDHTYPGPGVYTIMLAARAETGCADTIRKDVRVYERPLVNAGADTSISQGYAVRLSASGGVHYSWSPVTGLDNSQIPDPVATPMVTTQYVVLAEDQYGCENTDTLTVSVTEDYRLIPSNVFTPDGNGINDTWVIRNVETFGTVNVRVYDRYGTLVFREEAYRNDWAGTYGNDLLPDGTYYYLITFSDAPVEYNGAITIMRNR